MLATLPCLIFIAVAIIKMLLRGEPDVVSIVMVAGVLLLFLALAIVFALVHKFTVDFVVPIMFLRGGKCLAAWREFYTLLMGNPGQFALYILFQIVLGMAIGAITLFAIIITCCCAGCLLAIPYIGTAVAAGVGAVDFQALVFGLFSRAVRGAIQCFPARATFGSASNWIAAADAAGLVCGCQYLPAALSILPAMEFAVPHGKTA